jgi:hypothetical protein
MEPERRVLAREAPPRPLRDRFSPEPAQTELLDVRGAERPAPEAMRHQLADDVAGVGHRLLLEHALFCVEPVDRKVANGLGDVAEKCLELGLRAVSEEGAVE